MSRLSRYRLLRQVDEVAHLSGRCPAKVDHDVAVLVEDACATVHVPLQSALVDEPTCAYAVDLLEDRTSTRVEPKIGVAVVPPREVLAHDPPRLVRVLGPGANGAPRAKILCPPWLPGPNPSRAAIAPIVEDARFDAKLTQTDVPGEPLYPRWLFYYYCTHLRTIPQPSFLLDITGYQEKKRLAILSYETQFVLPEKNREIVDWLDAAAVFMGSRIRTAAAEPFFVKEPIGLRSLDDLT